MFRKDENKNTSVCLTCGVARVDDDQGLRNTFALGLIIRSLQLRDIQTPVGRLIEVVPNLKSRQYTNNQLYYGKLHLEIFCARLYDEFMSDSESYN